MKSAVTTTAGVVGLARPRAQSTPAADALIASEAALVEAVLAGDVDQFRPLVQRYQGPLLATIARIVRSTQEAQDIAQQTFIDAFDALGRFDTTRRFSTWLFRIGVNNAKDWLKSRKRGEQRLDGNVRHDDAAFAGSVPQPDRMVSAREDIERLRRALAQLPLEFREVIILKDIRQLPYSEIHAMLGHPITTLKIRAVRGRAALRKLLEQA